MKSCIFKIGSMTYAQKARRALKQKRIQSRIVKTDASHGKGCTFGIEFDEKFVMEVAGELRLRKISYELTE